MAIVTIDGIPVFQALVDSEDTGMLRISLVDDPAVQSDFVAFDAAKKLQTYAVEDEERRLVLGCVMRADFPIYRRDESFGEYYIIYRADTIRTMAEKYLAENRQNLVNLMHKNGTDQEGVQMVQWFIKGDGLHPEGFEGIADGSLFAEYHVTNDDVWEAIKAGTYRGFSLEGVFDMAPERDRNSVQEIVDALDGIFRRNYPKSRNMAKMKGIIARLAAALAAEMNMGNVTTDRGVIAWDGSEDLKVGDNVYVEDEDGERSAAPDGDYATADGVVYVVEGGKVAEIRDAAAPDAAPAVEAGDVNTDNGVLEWDGDGDLREGDSVYVRDADGNRIAAPDGEYTTEDGKTVTVVDGKVASISDPSAEVAPEGGQAMGRQRIAQAFQETYDEKMRKLAEAIEALGFAYPWIIEAGDEYVIASVYSGDSEHYFRFDIREWNEDGNPVLENGYEVEPAFVRPEDREQIEANMAAITAERDTLLARVAELEQTPAADPAHETYEGQAPRKTGVKGLDNIARLMGA